MTGIAEVTNMTFRHKREITPVGIMTLNTFRFREWFMNIGSLEFLYSITVTGGAYLVQWQFKMRRIFTGMGIVTYCTAGIIDRAVLDTDLPVWLVSMASGTELSSVPEGNCRIIRCMRAVTAQTFAFFSRFVSVGRTMLFFIFFVTAIAELTSGGYCLKRSRISCGPVTGTALKKPERFVD